MAEGVQQAGAASGRICDMDLMPVQTSLDLFCSSLTRRAQGETQNVAFHDL